MTGSALAEVRGAPARILDALCVCAGVAHGPQPAVAALCGDTRGLSHGGLQQGGLRRQALPTALLAAPAFVSCQRT